MALPNGSIEVFLENSLKEDLMLERHQPPFPDVIPRESERSFKVDAGPRHIAYASGSGIKWIIAWSNAANDFHTEPKKVHTQILFQTEAVDWDEIQKALEKSGHGCKVCKGRFESDLFWRGTALKATLQPPADGNNPEPEA